MEKLGLNFNASTREAHKGVYASLTSTEYPNAIKQNISQLLKSIDKKMVADMIEARSLKLDLSGIFNKFQLLL